MEVRLKQPLLSFLCVRLMSLVLIQTWFVPDEYWQATEVAHRIAFGYGYLTWEWQEGLRSVFYPGIIAVLYRFLHILHLDYTFLLIHIPRVLHAIAFSVGDYCAWKFSLKVYGPDSASWTAICLMSSWFLEFCAPRTLTSCLEMVLVSIALSKFPWKQENRCSSTEYLWWIGMACVLRPTAAVPLLPLAALHWLKSHSKGLLLLKSIIAVLVILFLSVLVDSLYYNKLTVVPWNFLRFNVVSGLAAHYGTHPWHWYIIQGLPVTLGTHMIPFLLGTIKYTRRHQPLLILCFWTITIYSFLGHKEFRFMLPILPVCMCVAGDYISCTLLAQIKKEEEVRRKWTLFALLSLIIPNVLTVLYLGLVHQRAPIDIMSFLQKEAAEGNTKFLFLMPCHSTPFYSHLHVPSQMEFLTCEPNFSSEEGYVDEADMFYHNPVAWLFEHYSLEVPSESETASTRNRVGDIEESRGILPTHLIMFDKLAILIQHFLEVHEYTLCHSAFNAHVEDSRKGKQISVYCRP